MLTQHTFFFIWPFFFCRPTGSGHTGLRSLAPAKTVGPVAAARPLSPAVLPVDRIYRRAASSLLCCDDRSVRKGFSPRRNDEAVAVQEKECFDVLAVSFRAQVDKDEALRRRVVASETLVG